MPDPIDILKRYVVMKFMEQSSLKSNTELQGEFIKNAIDTAEAVHQIGNIGMFNFNQSKDQQQQPPQYGSMPNVEMPKVEMPNVSMPNQTAEQKKYYEDAQKEQIRIQKYHQVVMQINKMLMEMQQNFFQNVQKIQQDLNQVLKDIF